MGSMSLYSHRQFVLLLLLVAAAGVGFAVDHWRRAHPDLAERLEQLDRAPTAVAGTGRGATAPDARLPRPPKRAPPDAPPLDVNLASAADFQRLPGIGPALAARIVDARAREGPFASVDDLRRVRGVGPATLERLRPRLAVNTP